MIPKISLRYEGEWLWKVEAGSKFCAGISQTIEQASDRIAAALRSLIEDRPCGHATIRSNDEYCPDCERMAAEEEAAYDRAQASARDSGGAESEQAANVDIYLSIK